MWIAKFYSLKITDFQTCVFEKNEHIVAAEITDSWCKDNQIEPAYELVWEK